MNSTELAKQIRLVTAKMVYKASASHIGGALSMADILAVLYADVLHFDQQKYEARLDEFFGRIGLVFDGNASEKVAEEILRRM